jgi:hypothetical protein
VGEHEWVWRQWLVNNPVNGELENILDKLIEFGTKRRYQSASEVLQALQKTPPSIQLKSARGIDYTKLRDFLAQSKWKEADKETAKVMLQVANRTSSGWLRIEDIDNFPCEDLRTIDQLWLEYSSGRFGFSVQAKIYRSLGGTQKLLEKIWNAFWAGGMREYNEKIWYAFGDKVGWRVDNSWNYKIKYDLEAPQGHLPWFGWGCIGGSLGRWGLDDGVGVSSLASRLVKCNI